MSGGSAGTGAEVGGVGSEGMPLCSTAAFDDAARQRVAGALPGTDTEAMALLLNLIRMANRVVQDFETNVHRPLGLSWAGFRMLFTLFVLGPMEQHDVARYAGVSRAAASSVLATLERDGHVTRERSVADRRMVAVALTPAGRRLVTRAYKGQREREPGWVAPLDRGDRAELNRLLRALLAHHPDGDEA